MLYKHVVSVLWMSSWLTYVGPGSGSFKLRSMTSPTAEICEAVTKAVNCAFRLHHHLNNISGHGAHECLWFGQASASVITFTTLIRCERTENISYKILCWSR